MEVIILLKRLFLLKILLTISLIILFNCERNKDNITGYIENRETGNTQEYFIYSTILNSFQDIPNPVFVLSDSTVFYDFSDDIDYIKGHFPDLQDDTINNYLTINQQNIELLNIPDLEITCSIIDNENKSRWKELYPNADALIHLSQVGFNTNKDQGLVYFSDYSAPLSASGNLILLNKENSGWIIVKSLMLWIS